MKAFLLGHSDGVFGGIGSTQRQSVKQLVFVSRAEALGHLNRSDDQLLDTPDCGALGNADALVGFVGCAEYKLDGIDSRWP